ncbi:MAG: hypothetical protein IKI97_03685, partial [Clostridia bacterium]|nr:hypothetical protein [Clostridia bacterium]
ITLELCDELSGLEPFGTSNPVPLLYMRDAVVKNVISLGQNKHTKLVVEKDGKQFDALLFGYPGDSFAVPQSGCIDILFNLDINEFRGERTPQLIIRGVRLCKRDAEKCVYYTEIMHSILEGRNTGFVPEISLCRTVYKYLRANSEYLLEGVNLYILSDKISRATEHNISCPVLGVILEVFRELGLVILSKTDDLIMKITVVKECGKVDIESSKVLMRARNIQQ